MSASQRSALVRSASVRRPQTINVAGRSRAAMVLMQAISSSPMAGMPISISGTPAADKAQAMAHFSSTVNATPAVCSPSRKVVSLMMRFRGMVWLPLPTSLQGACHLVLRADLSVLGGTCRPPCQRCLSELWCFEQRLVDRRQALADHLPELVLLSIG